MNTYSLIHGFYKQAMDDYLYTLYVNLIKKHAKTPSLLEIGCGLGEISRRVNHFFDKVDAFDNNPEMIAHAKKYQQTVNFFIHDMHHPLNQKYDTIIAPIDVFNHCESWDAFESVFKLWMNHLNPGGVMIFDLLKNEYIQSIKGYEEMFDIDNKHYAWKVKKGSHHSQVIHEVTHNGEVATHKEIAFDEEKVNRLLGDYILKEQISIEERNIYIIEKKTTS